MVLWMMRDLKTWPKGNGTDFGRNSWHSQRDETHRKKSSRKTSTWIPRSTFVRHSTSKRENLHNKIFETKWFMSPFLAEEQYSEACPNDWIGRSRNRQFHLQCRSLWPSTPNHKASYDWKVGRNERWYEDAEPGEDQNLKPCSGSLATKNT